MTIELFLSKLHLKSSEVIYFDQAIETGLPFWKPDAFDSRIESDQEEQQPHHN